MAHRKRVCFQLQVKKDRIDEYKARHRAVWPDMLDALRQTGWSNYSLFLREDGLLIGYLETADFDQALAGMALQEVNNRWQTEMKGFFADAQQRPADRQLELLEEVFHLD
ncbi:MAG TPA: L-rhamnose mutarotase [Bryobacteraceae bacterium]|jgi:L-rhamnose mutarotase|nr:L-rhamnose mutarotase [Bryobacteraceae bacterium]